MAGAKRRFGIAQRSRSEQRAEDFAAVFAGDLAGRPSIPLDLALDAIEPSPFQARMTFEDLDELAAAIKVHGFTSRIRVRPHPVLAERYQLVFGERRLRAARMAGLTTIPVEVAEHSDSELREIGLTENLLRRDLNPLEEGRAFVAALDAGYSVRSLSERIGKSSKGYVENRVAVARGPQDVQAMVEQRPDTLRAARAIMALPSERERRPLIQALLEGRLTANDVDAVVREQRGRATDGSQPPQPAPGIPQAQPRVGGDQDQAAGTLARRAGAPTDGAGAAAREQRQENRSVRQLDSEIVQVLAVVGRWRETPLHSERERQTLSRGLTRLLKELDALVRSLETDTNDVV